MRHLGEERGYTLYEMVVYVAVLAVVGVVAAKAVSGVMVASGRVSRLTDDFARILLVGERWRDDIRSAAEAPEIVGDILRIRRKAGEVLYRFTGGTLSRRQEGAGWEVVMAGIASSKMIGERRGAVDAWRWEVELFGQPNRPKGSIKPLFTFQAVPAGSEG